MDGFGLFIKAVPKPEIADMIYCRALPMTNGRHSIHLDVLMVNSF